MHTCASPLQSFVRGHGNSLLQLVEADDSQSIMVATTNCVGIIDQAFHRRFDAIVEFRRPSPKDIHTLIYKMTGVSLGTEIHVTSLADVVSACRSALKDAVLADRDEVSPDELIAAFELLWKSKCAR